MKARMSSFTGGIGGLRAQRQLAQASDLLTRSLERLSTGSRINRASDDAAGLSISSRLQANARLYGAALRNVNDGLSLINIADSTLENQSTIVDRLKELATQAATGTLSLQQRSSLQTEYRQLLEEFGRLGATATFNGQLLLSSGANGGRSRFDFQVGISGGSDTTISVSAGNTIRWSGQILASEATGNGDTISDFNDYFEYLNALDGGIESFAARFPNAAELSIRDSNGNTRRVVMAAYEVDDASLAFTFAEIAADGSLKAISVNSDSTCTLSAGYDPSTGKVSGSVQGALAFVGGGSAQINLDIGNLSIVNSGSSSAIDLTNISTASFARLALDRLGARSSELQQLRSTFGATANRLAVTANLLSAARENVEQANSRIRDVDVASESATLVAAQIRQQVAATVLGQTRSLAALLLGLIDGR